MKWCRLSANQTGVTHLGVAVQLGSKMRVVEQELQSLLRVIVAQVLKSGPTSAATRLGILETGCVYGDDGRDCVGCGRDGSVF